MHMPNVALSGVIGLWFVSGSPHYQRMKERLLVRLAHSVGIGVDKQLLLLPPPAHAASNDTQSSGATQSGVVTSGQRRAWGELTSVYLCLCILLVTA